MQTAATNDVRQGAGFVPGGGALAAVPPPGPPPAPPRPRQLAPGTPGTAPGMASGMVSGMAPGTPPQLLQQQQQQAYNENVAQQQQQAFNANVAQQQQQQVYGGNASAPFGAAPPQHQQQPFGSLVNGSIVGGNAAPRIAPGLGNAPGLHHAPGGVQAPGGGLAGAAGLTMQQQHSSQALLGAGKSGGVTVMPGGVSGGPHPPSNLLPGGPHPPSSFLAIGADSHVPHPPPYTMGMAMQQQSTGTQQQSIGTQQQSMAMQQQVEEQSEQGDLFSPHAPSLLHLGNSLGLPGSLSLGDGPDNLHPDDGSQMQQQQHTGAIPHAAMLPACHDDSASC